MTGKRSIGSTGLDGITFNGNIDLCELFKVQEIREECQKVSDGTKHHIYRPPRNKEKFHKKAPIYTKEYTMEDVFSYVLNEQAGQYIRTKFDELLTSRKKSIKRLFEFYKEHSGKFNQISAKDFEGKRTYIGRTLLQLCQAGVLRRENTSEKGSAEYVYTKNEDVVSDKDVVTKLIQNSEAIIGWSKHKQEDDIPESLTSFDLEEKNGGELMSTSHVEKESIEVPPKEMPSELQEFNDGWFQFSSLFPLLTFEDYLEMFLKNRQKEN